MALTRKLLKSMGLTDEQIDSVIEEHTNTVNGLKDEVTKLKESAERLPSVQKELDDLKKVTADYDDWKIKYTDEHKAFEDYKKDVETKATTEKLRNAYKALLKANNVDEKRLDTILKVTDLTSKKLTEDGKFENEKELSEAIQSEWKDFVVTSANKGVQVDTPPSNGSSELSNDAKYIRERASKRHAGTYGKGEE